MDWWRNNMKKGGSSSITPQGCSGTMHSKIAKPSIAVHDSFHSKPVAKFADGGMVDEQEMKQRGLAASNAEKPTGFFRRLREGNIDDPRSEAYKKYGAGRGRAEAAMDKAESEMTANQSNARAGSASMRDDKDFAAVEKDFETTRAVAGAEPAKVTPVRPQGRVEVRNTPARPKSPAPAKSRSETRAADVKPATEKKAESAPAPAPAPAPAQRRSSLSINPAILKRQEADEQRRADRRAPRQAERAAARAEWNAMSPAERSQARGRRLKEMLGLAKKESR